MFTIVKICHFQKLMNFFTQDKINVIHGHFEWIFFPKVPNFAKLVMIVSALQECQLNNG